MKINTFNSTNIPSVLLGPASTVENFIESFKLQLSDGEGDDIKKLIQCQNGPLLSAATLDLPMIRDRIEQVKVQVTERMNPILEQN
jgi:hypothetical protein